MAVFTLSSLAAGLAGSGGVLIASRAVQGVGAALLMPTTLAIIMATFPNIRERTMAIGIWAAVGALALAAGPVLGGLISQHVRWGWIFLINVPVGVITFAIAALYVDESRASSAVRRLDLPGLVTSALALFALTYALIEGDVERLDRAADPRARSRWPPWRPRPSSPSSRAPPTRWWTWRCSAAASSAAAAAR